MVHKHPHMRALPRKKRTADHILADHPPCVRYHPSNRDVFAVNFYFGTSATPTQTSRCITHIAQVTQWSNICLVPLFRGGFARGHVPVPPLLIRKLYCTLPLPTGPAHTHVQSRVRAIGVFLCSSRPERILRGGAKDAA